MRKILSIDGGGIKGVFPISFLAAVEKNLNVKTSEYFDLIVGTSTGGIIALGLGLGFSAQDILAFYEENGPDIFKGNNFFRGLISFVTSKYSNEFLKNSLSKKFEERLLGESKTRLVIPSLNLETGEVHVYKTSHNERFQCDCKLKAVDVALATSAAPTYFPTHNLSSGTPLVDGGLWANNPMGVAAVEALGVLEWPKSEIKLLSIGCTTEPVNIKKARKLPMGKYYWAPKVVDLFMAAQSSASLGTAQLLLGHDNVVRISPVVANGKFSLDAVKEIDSLKGLGDSEARKALSSIKSFFQEKVEIFTPYH